MMTAEQLKNSIYQLAIQGKLVEQCDSDGNAVDLVYEIEKKKKSLLKNGKIKPLKGIEPIDEVPFDLPESWTWVRLGSIVSIISDGTHRTPKYVENGVPFLSVQNISQGYFDMTKAKYITPDEHKELIKRCKPEKDDILVCRIGTLGKAIKVSVDFEFSIFVSLGLVRLMDARLVDYVICVINSGYGKKWIDEVKVGGGTHTNKINLKSFPNFLIPLPPLNEQARILEKLDEFKSLLSEYSTASTKLNTLNTTFPEMMKKSILQEAVQGKLVPQDPNDEPASLLLKKIAEEKKRLIKNGLIKKSPKYEKVEPPFEIPEKWSWTRLYELLNFIDYRGKTPQKLDSGIDLIGAWNIKQGYLDMSKNHKYISRREYETRKGRGLTKKGDILFITEGGTMGNACINTLDCECTCGQRVITLQEFGSVNLCMEYFMYVILSPYFQSMIAANATGSAAMGIKAAVLKTFWVPVPPFEEQKRIVEKAKELIQLTDKMTQ